MREVTTGRFKAMAEQRGHGYVVPRPDGNKTRCMGPPSCWTCSLEQFVYNLSKETGEGNGTTELS